MALIDTHCHLNHEAFENELDSIIQNAKDANFQKLFTISTKLSEINALEQLSNKYDFIYHSIGIHPHYASEETARATTVAKLVKLTNHPKAIGIGESGLDYYYKNAEPADQKKNFEKHIEASLETGLPLIVHSREAEDDTNTLLKSGAQKGNLRGVLHCFSSQKKLAESALELGFYISASGIITFKKSEELREIFAQIPTSRLLLETDAPYLAPVPMRGKRNEPAFMIHTAKILAELKNCTLEEIIKITSKNAKMLFSKAF